MEDVRRQKTGRHGSIGAWASGWMRRIYPIMTEPDDAAPSWAEVFPSRPASSPLHGAIHPVPRRAPDPGG